MKKTIIKWCITLAVIAVVIFLGWKTVTDLSFSLVTSRLAPSQSELAAQVEQLIGNESLPNVVPSTEPTDTSSNDSEEISDKNQPTQSNNGNQPTPKPAVTVDYALKNMNTIQAKMSSGDKSTIISIVLSRLTPQDKQQIAAMMKDGISGNDVSAGMAIARQRLTGGDISRILSIVSKYV